MDIALAKRRVRDEFKGRAIPGERLVAISNDIRAHIAASEAFAKARVVMLYASLPDEVSLEPLAIGARAAGKRTAYPRNHWPSKTITPTLVTDERRDLVLARIGLREPSPDRPAMHVSEIDLIIIPALAFDLAGHRLGRGAGFYDRFLATPGLRATLMGVAPAERVLAPGAFPVEAHDLPVDLIATEAGVRAVRPPSEGSASTPPL